MKAIIRGTVDGVANLKSTKGKEYKVMQVRQADGRGLSEMVDVRVWNGFKIPEVGKAVECEVTVSAFRDKPQADIY